MSVQNTPLKGQTDLRESSRILATETIGLSCGVGDAQLVLDLSRRLARAVAIEGHDFAPKRVGELRNATAWPDNW
jgi:hypothetical protein